MKVCEVFLVSVSYYSLSIDVVRSFQSTDFDDGWVRRVVLSC